MEMNIVNFGSRVRLRVKNVNIIGFGSCIK